MTVSNLSENYSSFNADISVKNEKDLLQDKIGTGIDFSQIMVQRTTDTTSVSQDLTESIKTNQTTNSVTNEPKTEKQDVANLYEKSQNSANSDKVKPKSEELSEEDVEAIAEKLDTFVSEAKDLVKEQLDVTDEEVEAALEELGLTVLDLSNPENLTNLLQNLSGEEDKISILLDSDMSDLMTDVKTMVNTLLEETGLSIGDLNAISESVKTQDADFAEILTEMTAVTPEESEAILPEIQMEASDVVPLKENGLSSLDIASEKPETIFESVTPETEVVTSQEVKTSSEKDDSNDEEEPADASGQKVISETQEETVESQTTTKVEFTLKNQGEKSSLGNENQAGLQNNVQTEAQVEVETPVEEVTSYRSIDTADIIDQIVTEARVTNVEDMHTMEMTLNPEHLGKLHMEVTERDGVVRARILTENENVKNALVTAMEELKESLNQQGSKVNEIEISVGAREFRENEERETAELLNQNGQQSNSNAEEENQSRGRRNINMNRLDDLSGIMSDEERLVVEMMRTEGNTVNLQA